MFALLEFMLLCNKYVLYIMFQIVLDKIIKDYSRHGRMYFIFHDSRHKKLLYLNLNSCYVDSVKIDKKFSHLIISLPTLYTLDENPPPPTQLENGERYN